MKYISNNIPRVLAFALNMAMLYEMGNNILYILGYTEESSAFIYLTDVNKIAHITFLLLTLVVMLSSKKVYITMTIGILWVCLELLSLIITPGIAVILFKCIFYTVRNVLVLIFYFTEIDDYKRLETELIPYIYIGIVFSFTQIGAFRATNLYSMQYSYSSIIPGMLCIILALNQKKFRYCLMGMIFVFVNIMCGSRGVLLCYFILAVLYILIFLNQKQRWFVITMFSILCVVLFLNVQNIFSWLYQLFPDSRTIQLFAEGDIFHMSSRDKYYGFVINGILDSPLKINGLYSDRYYIGQFFARENATDIFGSYAHNFILEVLFQFGIWGIPFLLFVISSIGYSIHIVRKSKDKSLMALFIVFTAYCIGQLLFSSSYLTEVSFGCLVGIMLSVCLKRKRLIKWKNSGQ